MVTRLIVTLLLYATWVAFLAFSMWMFLSHDIGWGWWLLVAVVLTPDIRSTPDGPSAVSRLKSSMDSKEPK